jgi:hypothetical protein
MLACGRRARRSIAAVRTAARLRSPSARGRRRRPGKSDAPGFVLHNDGTPLDRERLIAHVASGRKRAAEVRVAVRDVATTGDVVAARYVLTAVMRKGEVIDTEIFMFGRLAPDGRLREVTQLTRR